MATLKDKVVVITGGNSGIGYAAAQRFQSQEAKVVITGRKQEAVAAAAAELGVAGITSDQSSLHAIDKLVTQVSAQHGKVDVLFINAGVGFFLPIEAVTEAHFDSIMDINFKGAFFTLSKFIPVLNDGASVIFLSSVNATAGMATAAIYSASKAAMNSLMKVAATELAPRGIRVNAVSPGPINTPIFGKTGMDEETIKGFAGAMQQRIPLKRFGAAEEVAKLVVFLAGSDAAFISGSEYVIDGGINVNPILS